jgi:hypothetical protein
MRSVDETTNLLLPYILAAQAQKHVTHNEALRKLDALVQISVADRHLAVPPASPLDGQRYIVAASATGAWSGHTGKIAAWQDGAWEIYAPREGFIAWVEDEDIAVAWSGSGWVPVGGGSLNPAPFVGVNATADTTNRLAVSSPATLFNHAGAGHQFKINKNTAGDTASVLFQTGFSGRAEMGLAGSDDYSFKVSPDGSAWFDAIVIDRTTGEVSFPNTSIGGGGGGVMDGDKGDVVVSGGGAAWAIDSNAVTNAKLADMATQTFKGRVSAGPGDPEDLTMGQLRTAIALPTTTVAGRLARYTNTAGAQGQTSGIFEDASGNVGIGTTTPNAPLHVVNSANRQLSISGWSSVEGASPFAGEMRIGEAGAYFGRIHYSWGDLYFDNTNDAVWGDIYFRTRTSGTPVTMLTLSGGGQVLFGRQVQITDPAQAQLWVYGWSAASGAGATEGEIRLGVAADQGRIHYSSGDLIFENTGNASFYDIRFRTRTNGTPVEALTITGDGNIALNATNPVCRLDVAGGPIRKRTSYTVATLPAASLGDGMETYVTDSNATLAAGHGNVVAGGGSNYVPVYSRGGQWLIG